MSELIDWIASGPWPIDGGLSGELEKLGHDLGDDLWSARLLRDDPQAIATVQRAYIQSGARVLITSSYQASRLGFMNVGMTAQEADGLMRTSIRIAQEVTQDVDHKVWVAASVGPYGAVLGGGQEYQGNYGKSHEELVAFHRERIEVLASAKPDLFACETIPDIVEVKALLEVLADYPHIPAWITMSCKDGEKTCAGQSIAELGALTEEHSNIVAIGVNCTMPEFVESLLATLRTASTKPFIVYPNTGRVWDGVNHCWVGEGLETIPSIVVGQWVKLGTQLIGGCCGLGPIAIENLDRDLAPLR